MLEQVENAHTMLSAKFQKFEVLHDPCGITCLHNSLVHSAWRSHQLWSGPLCFAQSPLDTSHAYGSTSGGPCRQLPHVRIGFWLIPTNQKFLWPKPPSLTTTLTFNCSVFGGGQDKYVSLFPMNGFCLVVMLIKWTTFLQIDEGALLQLRCTVSTIQRFTLSWSVKI